MEWRWYIIYQGSENSGKAWKETSSTSLHKVFANADGVTSTVGLTTCVAYVKYEVKKLNPKQLFENLFDNHIRIIAKEILCINQQNTQDFSYQSISSTILLHCCSLEIKY